VSWKLNNQQAFNYNQKGTNATKDDGYNNTYDRNDGMDEKLDRRQEENDNIRRELNQMETLIQKIQKRRLQWCSADM